MKNFKRRNHGALAYKSNIYRDVALSKSIAMAVDHMQWQSLRYQSYRIHVDHRHS